MNNTKLRLIGLFASLIVLSLSNSRAADAEKMYRACKMFVETYKTPSADLHKQVESGYCLGFFEGLNATYVHIMEGKPKQLYCLPKGTTEGAAIESIVKYMDKNSYTLQQTAETSMLEALWATYQCPNK